MTRVAARGAVRAGCVLAMLTAMGGCAMVPLVSDSQVWGSASLDEQRAWAEMQIEDSLGVLDEPHGWWTLSRELQWPEKREAILGGAQTANCRPSEGSQQPGRLVIDLLNTEIDRPFEVAERLRRHWANQGWTVRDVLDRQDLTARIEYFRAERDDGANLSFRATENLVALGIISSCSDHASVVYRY